MELIDKRKKRILVVDDDRNIVEIIPEILKDRYGFYTHGICFNGINSMQEVMGQLCTKSYDLMLLDIVMPEINGLDLTKRIRSEGLSISIILMTGFSIPIRAIESMRSGADDLVIKPFQLEDLKSSIDVVLKQRSLQISKRTQDRKARVKSIFGNLSRTQNPNFHGLIKDYYERGELLAELSFRKGKLDGISKVYRKWGTILAEVSFRNGLADGRNKWFGTDGHVLLVEDYHNGETLRRRIYDNTGNVQQEILH